MYSVCLCIFLGFLEGVFWLAEKKFGVNAFNLLRRNFAESFFYQHAPEGFVQQVQSGVLTNDPLLGWSDFRYTQPRGSSVNWFLESEKTNRKRIAVLGDSFTYGWEMPDEDTFPSQLNRELGTNYSVMNFGVRGFGIDQMVLTGIDLVATQHPDLVVLAFIGADLDRSCWDFGFNMKKPSFVVSAGGG